MKDTSDPSTHRKLALIIGNSVYHRQDNYLRHAVTNAKKLNDALQTMNFTVTAHSNIYKEIMKTISSFAETITDGDIVLFYYSGHCRQVDGENYLIPTDDDRITRNIDVKDIGSSATRALSKLTEKNKSYVTIFILDCCKQYLFKNESASDSMAQDKGLTEMTPSDDTFIQFACAANQIVSAERGQKQDNLFAKRLLKNITQEDVCITDVFQQIVSGVVGGSAGKQQPLSMDGLGQHGQDCLYVMSDGDKINDCNSRIADLKRELEELTLKQPHSGSSYNRLISRRINHIRALLHTLTLRRSGAVNRCFSARSVK